MELWRDETQQIIRFRYVGPSIESVLDRLPTAIILAVNSDSWDVEVRVLYRDIETWINSQGDFIQRCEIIHYE